MSEWQGFCASMGIVISLTFVEYSLGLDEVRDFTFAIGQAGLVTMLVAAYRSMLNAVLS